MKIAAKFVAALVLVLPSLPHGSKEGRLRGSSAKNVSDWNATGLLVTKSNDTGDLLGMPEGYWIPTWRGINCYTEHPSGRWFGAENIGASYGNIGASACDSRCRSTSGCTCYVVSQSSECWLRKNCNYPSCVADSFYSTTIVPSGPSGHPYPPTPCPHPPSSGHPYPPTPSPVPPSSGYGKEFRFKANSNFCLSVDANSFRNGQNMQMWECSRSSGQLFVWNHGHIQVAQDPRYCVVIDGNKNQDGANIQLWECDFHNAHMGWEEPSFADGPVVNIVNGKCMVVDRNHAHNGANVQLWSCQGMYYEQWSMNF